MSGAKVKSKWTSADEALWAELSERRIRIREENTSRLRTVLIGINNDVCANDGASCGLGDSEVWAEAMTYNADALIEALTPFSKAQG